ncbi:MAG: MFS transporter [Proteobacteria bacterium]|nr:MFS transporter [Pseudomonadota bacterium]
MRLLISFAALMLSIILLQLSTGAISPLDALSGLQEGFTKTQIGLLGSSHFFGFFIGCWWAPRLIGTIGHSRTFAVFAAMGTIGAIAHPMWIDVSFWAFLRILSGLCVAGCYTVIEAWFQAKLTNDNRGKVMGVYRVVDIGASSVAQLMIGFLEPAAYVSYNLLAIMACACILPLTLTTSKQPEVPSRPRLHPIRTAITSPLGVAGVIVAGISSSSFRMAGPIYGQDIGLTPIQIGQFLAAVLVGGAVTQIPVGWIADKYDRRWVLLWLSVTSVAVCLIMAWVNSSDPTTIYIMAFMFGLLTYPIFSVSVAHANDFSTPAERVELNASLLFCYGIGAIFSPLIASALIQNYGPAALFNFIAIAHIGLLVFGLVRMRARPATIEKTGYRYTPRTTFTIGKLLKRKNLD